MEKGQENFFSVSFELILVDKPIPYDLYMNSSTLKSKEHFIRLFAINSSVTENELRECKYKYYQLYVNENQREIFLNSLTNNKTATDIQKTEFIKNSAITYLDKLFDKDKEFSSILLSEILSGCKRSVQSMVQVLKGYDLEKVQLLIADLSIHDFYTYDHSINVSMYCITLFSKAKPNATEEEIVMAGMGGLLHDIGKINISNEIINKPERLTTEEMKIINEHPKIGFELLKHNQCSCPGVNFEVLQKIVHEHHENFNGTGYPNKLEGSGIHFMSRLTTIADFFDAITTKRAYHKPMTMNEALILMKHSKGKKIDPNLFDIFTKKIDSIIFKIKLDKVLPENFDPCQPHNVLPFVKVKSDFRVNDISKKEKSKDYGSIKKKAS